MSNESVETMGTVEFRAVRDPLRRALLLLVFSAILFVLFGVLFALSIFGSSTSGLPIVVICGIAATGVLSYGLFQLRSVRAVIVTPEGISFIYALRRRAVRWSDVASVVEDRRYLMGGDIGVTLLRDASGKTLAELPPAFEGVREVIQKRLASMGMGVEVGEHLQADFTAEQERKTRRWMVPMTLALSLLFGWEIYDSGSNLVYQRRLATMGRVVDARVDRIWSAGGTIQIEYTFTDDQGRPVSRETEMAKGYGQLMSNVRVIQIRYLPEKPEWNRMVIGEKTPDMDPFVMMLMSAGMLILFIPITVLVLLGFNIKTDRGKWVVTRYGRVIRTYGGAERPR